MCEFDCLLCAVLFMEESTYMEMSPEKLQKWLLCVCFKNLYLWNKTTIVAKSPWDITTFPCVFLLVL